MRLICCDYSIEQVACKELELIGLLHPKQSHMDFNVGAALHFASKGHGLLFDEAFLASDLFGELLGKLDSEQTGDSNSYDFGVVTNKITQIDPDKYYARTPQATPLQVTSQAKVVLSGLGADEVWGGYSRYRTAAVKSGLAGLQAEMSLDLNRLWHRNMARDDRVISHNAKEARFPFLDRRV